MYKKKIKKIIINKKQYVCVCLFWMNGMLLDDQGCKVREKKPKWNKVRKLPFLYLECKTIKVNIMKNKRKKVDFKRKKKQTCHSI